MRVSSLSLLSAGWTAFDVSLLGMESSSVSGGVRLMAASMIGGPRAGSWSYKDSTDHREAAFFGLTWHHRDLVTT